MTMHMYRLIIFQTVTNLFIFHRVVWIRIYSVVGSVECGGERILKIGQ